MIAKRYEDLEAWQLADELRQEVFALTETGAASRDFKFRDQIRDAVSSAARNISEGFGRFRPADFARFMEFSLASAMEVQDLLTDGIERGHFTLEHTKRARNPRDAIASGLQGADALSEELPPSAVFRPNEVANTTA